MPAICGIRLAKTAQFFGQKEISNRFDSGRWLSNLRRHVILAVVNAAHISAIHAASRSTKILGGRFRLIHTPILSASEAARGHRSHTLLISSSNINARVCHGSFARRNTTSSMRGTRDLPVPIGLPRCKLMSTLPPPVGYARSWAQSFQVAPAKILPKFQQT